MIVSIATWKPQFTAVWFCPVFTGFFLVSYLTNRHRPSWGTWFYHHRLWDSHGWTGLWRWPDSPKLMSGPVPETREHPPPPCSRKDKVAFFYSDWIISSIPVFSLACSPLVKPDLEYLGTEMDFWQGFDHLVVECGVNGLVFSHGYLNHSNPNHIVEVLRGK